MIPPSGLSWPLLVAYAVLTQTPDVVRVIRSWSEKTEAPTADEVEALLARIRTPFDQLVPQRQEPPR